MNKVNNMKKIVSAAAGIAMILLPVSLSAEKKKDTYRLIMTVYKMNL